MLLRFSLLVLAVIAPLIAQNVPAPNERQEVDRVVRDYVGLYTADTLDRWKALFHPDLRVAHPAEDGSIRVRNLEEFLESQKRGFAEDPSMREVLENVRVDAARRMARVSADYVFTSAGRPSRGKLGLHLVRGTQGWKIVGIVFSYDDEQDCGASCVKQEQKQKRPSASFLLGP